MSKCTPKGQRGLPGLPYQELLELKEMLRAAYPQFLSTPHAFESHWLKAIDVIGQACNHACNCKRAMMNNDIVIIIEIVIHI